MDDIQRALAAAWKKIRLRLERDEAELRRRLLRRRQSLLQTPPRAWCLAVRAADTRLGLTESGSLLPSSAHSPCHLATLSPCHPPHSLTLTSADLAKLCAPVHLDAPGEPLRDVARKLGVSTGSLLVSRLKKVFRTTYDPCLAGRWGRPHPILYTKEPLDPATRGFLMPDPLWSCTARLIGSRIPDRIHETLARVPVFHDATRAFRDKSALHPEHPAVDRSFDVRPRNKSRKLPPPDLRDHLAGYKWKDGQYVGYDWRAAETNPHIKKNYERHQRQLEGHRRRNKRRRRISQSSGSLKFRGWAWLCPCCGRAVRVLFYPLPRLHLLPGKIPRLKLPLPGEERAGERAERVESNRARLEDNPLRYPKLKGFACKECHRVRYFSRMSKCTWGEIVSYLSAGLLYGNEVERPAWLIPQRKNKYAPKLNREPSKRRPQIEKLLLAGLTIKQTAAELGLSQGTILCYTKSIYHQHGVRSLKELLIKHGIPLRPHLRGPGLGKRGEGPVYRRKTPKIAAPT